MTGAANFLVDIVASHISPVLGLERAVLELVREFEQRGASIRIICLSGVESDVSLANDVIVCGPPQRGLRRANPFRALRARRNLRRGSVVILAGVWAAVPYLSVPSFDGRRVVVWEHSLIAGRVWSRGLRVLAFVARFAYRTANSVVCVSEPLAQDVSQSIRRPTTVIPNFLPGSEVDPPVRSEPGRLIMIGSLTPTKNHLTALDAVARLSMLESRLVIAGEGPYLARLRSRAEALGILDRVEFLGHVEQERLRLEVSRASCVLHTSVGETFGYAYFDGARSSRPVVAVTNPVAAWLIPTYIVGELAINDESSIAAAIKRVLEDPPSPDMFERARSRRDQVFSPSSIVDKWVRELKPL